LFLNKLRRKLQREIGVNQSLPGFGDRDNEIITVVKCKLRFLMVDRDGQILILVHRLDFREKFKENLLEDGSMYIYPTATTVNRITCLIRNKNSTVSFR